MKPPNGIIIIGSLLFLLFPSIAFSQTDSLRSTIEHIVNHSAGCVGVAVINLKNHDTLTVNDRNSFPMQSVYKFPVALAVLHQIDKGKFFLDQRIHITKSDLLPNTWSPLRDKYPDGNVDITLDELIATTVSLSDNNGCDILFRLIGGPMIVDQYIRSLGIDGMAIVATEEEMHVDWNVQYCNYSSPFAMAKLLAKFYEDSILSQKSREYLWQVMVKTTTGVKRLKGKLPEGTIVGHKTGSSGTNESGIAAATNDVGIVILPNKTPVTIVVFVSDSNSKENVREEIIADIAKAVWDSYLPR
jgi:beta-lactamase class A